jgi:hypothetical protein
MPLLVPIVEGYGEVQAFPELLRQMLHQRQAFQFEIARPIRIPKTRLLKNGEIERAVKIARLNSNCSGILILLDADEDRDCPKRLAPTLLKRATRASGRIPVRVILAKREYESWFIGAIASLRGFRGIPDHATPPADPEEIRGAKEWISKLLPRGTAYKETIDQVAFSKRMDLGLARGSCPSFDKLCRDIESLVKEISPSLF